MGMRNDVGLNGDFLMLLLLSAIAYAEQDINKIWEKIIA